MGNVMRVKIQKTLMEGNVMLLAKPINEDGVNSVKSSQAATYPYLMVLYF